MKHIKFRLDETCSDIQGSDIVRATVYAHPICVSEYSNKYFWVYSGHDKKCAICGGQIEYDKEPDIVDFVGIVVDEYMVDGRPSQVLLMAMGEIASPYGNLKMVPIVRQSSEKVAHALADRYRVPVIVKHLVWCQRLSITDAEVKTMIVEPCGCDKYTSIGSVCEPSSPGYAVLMAQVFHPNGKTIYTEVRGSDIVFMSLRPYILP